MNINKYKIPTSKLLLEGLIFAIYLVFLISPLIIAIVLRLFNLHTIENIVKDWLDIFVKLFGIFGIVVLLFFLPSLMALITYPVRKWILTKVNCPKCGNKLAYCEYSFQGLSSLANFVVVCVKCRKAHFLTADFLDTELIFKPLKEVENLYEQKYFGKIYKIPLFVGLYIFPLLLFLDVVISLIILIPVIILIVIFIPLDSGEKSLIILFLTILGIWIIVPVINKIDAVNKFKNYFLIKWIIKNTECQECKSKFEKCEPVLSYFQQFQFKVYCRQCKKNRKIGFKGYDWNLRFID